MPEWRRKYLKTAASVTTSVGHVFSTKEMGVTGRVYWHDDGNRKEMAEYLDRLIDVEIKVLEEETELFILEPSIEKDRQPILKYSPYRLSVVF